MDLTLTVRYSNTIKTIDVSSEKELLKAIYNIEKIIINRIKPLYKVILLINGEISEQMFKEAKKEFIDKRVGKYIENSLKTYFGENNEINIEGFIIFRLKKLWDVVDEAFRDYWAQEEHFRLKEHLSDLIEISESIYDKITIIVNDDNYTILNKNEEIICFLKKYDDTLLDVILNIAPKTIYIIGKDKFKNNLLLEDIKDIFKNRVVFI